MVFDSSSFLLFRCYCVDSIGTRLELYAVSRVTLNTADEYMNCSMFEISSFLYLEDMLHQFCQLVQFAIKLPTKHFESNQNCTVDKKNHSHQSLIECARDEAEYSKRGINNDKWLYKCDKKGNYAAVQCLHGSYVLFSLIRVTQIYLVVQAFIHNFKWFTSITRSCHWLTKFHDHRLRANFI